MVFCKECGTKGKDGAKFCGNCGTGLPMTAGAPTPGAPPTKPQGGAGMAPVMAPADATPPGCFKVRLPAGVHPGQEVQVVVPPGYPQAGSVVYAPLPQTCGQDA
ncbi:hypothetical protein T484DRAFT_1898764 [Baffinella frigidus]|nr:hypothetical protein T484DRAFT_1898764 [Cryptophyta sp. CCMP2293]